jgi:signal transduction histidine kinase/DNA-binding response OmpR family regulator
MSTAEKANILIVDDLPDKLLVLQSILEELDQKVIQARSGEEALRRVLENDFAVILLDVHMPGGMDGFETAALIRQRRRSAHIPIIFITAFADEMHTAQGYSLGAVDYILSPVIPEVLRTKVRVFVELFLMTQQVRRQADERVALAREQTARAAAEEANRRSAFLAEATSVLSRSLEPETTLRGLAQLVIPFLADLSAVVAVNEQGEPGATEMAWMGPEATVLTHTCSPPALPAPLIESVRHVLTSRRTEFQPACQGSSDKDRQLPLPAGAARPDSAVLLPLLARDRLLGVLVLTRAAGKPAWAPAEVALAEDLASRAAIALDNARLHQNIQEADRRKDEFLAMLGHELRNPLTPIRNAVEVMRMLGPRHPTLEQAREMIDRQVTQMTRLIDELLDVSRLSRGKILLRHEPLDFTQLVRRTAEDYRPSLEKSGLRLLVDLPDRPLTVRGDTTRLAQVIGNLLHNAGKFTRPAGEVEVSLAAGEAGRAVLAIRDTGIGIEPSMRERVFEAFTQLDQGSDRGGLGLGLTLVKRLVELHHGEVGIDSAGVGMGTTVWVSLPTEAASPSGTEPAQSACCLRLPEPLRILLIEDHPDVAESMRMALSLAGHQVSIAFTGAEGVNRAQEVRPDVVLCDIGLPSGMDGYAVARALRNDPSLASVYLIAATGYGQQEDQRRTREAGFDAHVTKPVDFAILKRLLLAQRSPSAVAK